MYELKSFVRYSEMDATEHLSLYAMLNYLQDTCCMQSEKLGIGVHPLMDMGLGWFIISWQIDIEELPAFTVPFTVQTECNADMLYAARNFYIKGEDGKQYVKAHSIWTMVDMENRRPTKIPEFMGDLYQYNKELKPNKLNRRIRLPEDMQEAGTTTVTHEFLDTNGHMNNSFYVLLAEKFLPEGFRVRHLRVEYKKEAQMGEELHLYMAETQDAVIVSLEDEARVPYAAVEFKN